jgi:hypothetical protein
MIASERTLAVASLLAAALLWSQLCSAQGRPKDPRAAVPAAQALFDEGKKLMARGAAAEACPKFEESQRLDPAIGTQFRLADCYEKIGRSASAWSTFLDAAGAARKADEGEREQAARNRARALEPKLTRVAVAVTARVEGLEIVRGGVAVGEAQWGLPLPVDPGPIAVRATAPGKKPFETSVEAKGAGRTVEVRVPALEDDPNAVVTPPVPSEPAAAPDQAPPPSAPAFRNEPAASPTPSDDVDPAGGRRTLALVAAAGGLVGIGVGAAFGFVSMAKGGDAEGHCRGDICDAEGVALRDDAITMGNVSTGAFAVGVVGLAAGAVLWFTAPSPSSPATGARAGLRAGIGNVGLEGRW